MSLWDPNIPKKSCQIQRSCDGTALRMTVSFLTWPRYCLCKAFGQFSHFQCMQSSDPSKSCHALASEVGRSLLVSATVGFLGYWGPKTSTTTVANLTMASPHVLSDNCRYSLSGNVVEIYQLTKWKSKTLETIHIGPWDNIPKSYDRSYGNILAHKGRNAPRHSKESLLVHQC